MISKNISDQIILRNHKIDVKGSLPGISSDVDIIMPSFKERKMAYYAVLSFLKFEHNLKIRIMLVDPSGKDKGFGISDERVGSVFFKDPGIRTSKTFGAMSNSNACALE